ncbi:hypothetical protein N0V93_004479 [Gnomoniopsis smithogilvyi]|uniref:Thioesterase domain-containing protein n=1 Tax=Gnomoniopsis smithogilvyi TaxID=1191159 RepID=A0A9W8YTT4_9PEZI|nr:hypothetical protein N0V93_004479 [Gnomoniopsis smithogilvyi]
MAAKGDPTSDDPEVAHFRAIPWCATHLAAPGLTILPAFSRSVKPRFEDALLSQTLKTHDTISAFICFYPQAQDDLANLPEVKAFVTFGNLISGYPGISHGGIVATVLDETLSFISPGSRWRLHKQSAPEVVTAYLNTRYLRPVNVPGTYLVRVWLVRAEGRKTFVEGYIENENGEKVAEADALFVEVRQKL